VNHSTADGSKPIGSGRDADGALRVATTILSDGRNLREIEPDIYTTLHDAETHHYDRLARVYDRLIGSPWYNRFVWGSDCADYTAFAHAACQAQPSGPYLDAGCGSMLFTAPAYTNSTRSIIAVDHSLGMLRRARARLRESNGTVPPHVLLLQADLLDLPFRDATFSTVLSMGMLHLFGDADRILQALRRRLQPRGRLYLSSLVLNGRRGDHYLRFLERRGEVAACRRVEDVRALVVNTMDHVAQCDAVGNIAYAIAGLRPSASGPSAHA